MVYFVSRTGLCIETANSFAYCSLDAFSHFYKRACLSVGLSIGPSVGSHTRVEIMFQSRFDQYKYGSKTGKSEVLKVVIAQNYQSKYNDE